LQGADDARHAPDHRRVRAGARHPPQHGRREGPRRAADRPDGRRDRERVPPCHGPAPERAAADAVPRARDATAERGRGMSATATGYARPAQLGEALHLLAQPGARPMAGGTDPARQLDRGLTAPALVVDLQELGLDAIAAAGAGVRVGGTATLATVATAPALE